MTEEKVKVLLCLDCLFTKKSCYEKGHHTHIQIGNMECDAINRKIIEFTKRQIK